MKNLSFFLILCALSVACTQNLCPEPVAEPSSQVPILFTAAAPLQASVQTRATVVTTENLASFYAAATTGSSSETSAWISTTFNDTDHDGTFNSTDKYWPVDNPSYHFYAANVGLTFAASGTTCEAINSTDVICAYLPSPTFQAPNALAFEHIFARLGTVTVSAASGYTVSDITLKIVPKVRGTYNIKTGSGHNDGTGWASTTNASTSSTIASKLGSNTNDIFMIPGSYNVTVSWTATKGAYTEVYSNKTITANFLSGKINALNITLGGEAKPISFTVSVTPWGSNTITATLPSA